MSGEEEKAIVNPVVENVAAQVVEKKTETDLEKLKTAAVNLRNAGEDLFKSEIEEIEKKIADEEKKIESETEKVVEEVKQAEQGFVEKYGAGAARAVEIVLLVAILYKLF